jgi:hypothetical protein
MINTQSKGSVTFPTAISHRPLEMLPIPNLGQYPRRRCAPPLLSRMTDQGFCAYESDVNSNVNGDTDLTNLWRFDDGQDTH